MNGADVVASVLKAHGVSFISTLIGNGIDPVLYACRQAGLRVIDTHNEQTASYMAESYARLTGQIGVCGVSSSVGFTNALIGAVNARFDGAPMLLIAGASEHATAGRGNFQDFDQVNAAAPIFKYSRLIDRPEDIAYFVREAIAAAVSGRPGPVHLTIPLDVLYATCDSAVVAPVGSGRVRPLAAADGALVAQAAAAIGEAQRPLLIAGSGAFYAAAEEALAAFVEQTNIPVMTPIWDRGSISKRLAQFMGVIGAASGSPPLLHDADLVILLGARVDYRVGYMQPPAVSPDATIVRISADADELQQGVAPHLALHGDARSVLRQLADLLPVRPALPHSVWLHEAQARDAAFRARWRAPRVDNEKPTGRDLIDALRPFITDDTIFVVDGGNIGQWVHMAMCDRYPGHWLTCGASGVVGFGVGGAMAARLAYPERDVILLSGDGSMGFNTTDFESAVRHDLPFTAIVADDKAWGIVVSGQQKRWGDDQLVACQLGELRFDMIATACGALGLRAETPAGLPALLTQALASGRPALIHVPIAHGGPADAAA